MWLFTLNSFVSVVRHRQDKNLLLIRARRRDDLVTLLGSKLEPEIKEDRASDYRWRVIMPEKAFKEIVSDYITSRLNYDNFKAAQKKDPEFSKFLHQVWHEGYKMQS